MSPATCSGSPRPRSCGDEEGFNFKMGLLSEGSASTSTPSSGRNRSTNLPGHAALAASFNPPRFNPLGYRSKRHGRHIGRIRRSTTIAG